MEKKDNNAATRAAANGEAAFVNGGIHVETSPVNCVAQYAAPGCSDHQAVTGRARALARTQILALKPSDHWCSEEERNHISAERGGEGKRQRNCVCVCVCVGL